MISHSSFYWRNLLFRSHSNASSQIGHLIGSKSRLYSTNSTSTRKVLSGIQPTGVPHIGNYLGAIINWKRLQDESTDPSNVLFSVVDMHTLTTSTDAALLAQSTRTTFATLMACGIDPTKSILFNQSRVPGHAELAWILTTLTPMGELKAMTQFKDKSSGNFVPLTGLFSYPVLMAADILLYKATDVPVGDDQIQHLEMAVRLAEKFNRVFGEPQGQPNFFPLPKCIHSPVTRVMSLKDANKKMSKSDLNELSRINLDDSADAVRKKLKVAKTDSISGITYDPVNRRDLANLIDIYAAFTGKTPMDVAQEHETHDMLKFKLALTDAVLSVVSPISQKICELKNNSALIDHVMDLGSKKANEQASVTMSQIRRLVGYL